MYVTFMPEALTDWSLSLTPRSTSPTSSIDKPPHSEERDEHDNDDKVLFQILIGKAVNPGYAVSAAEDVKGLDDPREKDRIHEGHDGEVDPPERQAWQDDNGADTGAAYSSEGYGEVEGQ